MITDSDTPSITYPFTHPCAADYIGELIQVEFKRLNARYPHMRNRMLRTSPRGHTNKLYIVAIACVIGCTTREAINF